MNRIEARTAAALNLFSIICDEMDELRNSIIDGAAYLDSDELQDKLEMLEIWAVKREQAANMAGLTTIEAAAKMADLCRDRILQLYREGKLENPERVFSVLNGSQAAL